MRLSIPGRRTYDLEHLVLDLNGTLGLDGKLLEGVAPRLALLKSLLRPVILTADTHGGAAQVRRELGVQVAVLEAGRDEALQKAEFVRDLGAERVVAVGNGANDVLMLKEAAIGICVLGPEGTATEAVASADLVVLDILTGLDLLLHPQRLVATLRR